MLVTPRLYVICCKIPRKYKIYWFADDFGLPSESLHTNVQCRA